MKPLRGNVGTRLKKLDEGIFRKRPAIYHTQRAGFDILDAVIRVDDLARQWNKAHSIDREIAALRRVPDDHRWITLDHETPVSLARF